MTTRTMSLISAPGRLAGSSLARSITRWNPILRLSMPPRNSLRFHCFSLMHGDSTRIRPLWHAFPSSPDSNVVYFYSMTLTDITDLEDESELGYYTTTGTVEVGGSVTGEIDVAHDADWFRVELKAGTTYRIRMRGAESDGGTLADPYLRVKDDPDVFTFVAPPVNDDKSATERDSEITWSPPRNEDYFIEANTKASGTGTYTIEVEVVTGGVRITGTARQGETLTADTSMIADSDGLTGASYTFQWVRVTDNRFGIEENIPAPPAAPTSLSARTWAIG